MIFLEEEEEEEEEEEGSDIRETVFYPTHGHCQIGFVLQRHANVRRDARSRVR